MSRSLRFAFLVTAIVGLVTGTVATLAQGHFRWGWPEVPRAQGEAIRPDTMQSWHLSYRERVRSAIIREPQNSWSNLAFVFVGALVFARDRRTHGQSLGVALFTLGFASGLYHASLLPAWRTVDVAAMGWVVFALGFFACSSVWPEAPLFPCRPAIQMLVSVIGLILAAGAAVFRNEVRIGGIKPLAVTYITGAGVAVIFGLLTFILVTARRHSNIHLRLFPRLGLLGVITLAAILCQLGDHPDQLLFQPDAFIQAHAVWHVLMALAAYLAYDTFSRIAAPAMGSRTI